MSGGAAAIAAVVFDLDGTLVDSAPDLMESLNAVLRASGRRPVSLAEARAAIGDGVVKLVERGFTTTGAPAASAEIPDLVERFLADYRRVLVRETRPFPGALAALDRLKARGLRLGVCTNKPRRESLDILGALGLAPYFDAVAGGDSFAVRKPDPGHVRGVLDWLGATASAAAMVGDSANDIDAGRGAGLRTIAVTWGYGAIPARDLGADAVIEDFAALAPAIEGMSGGQ